MPRIPWGRPAIVLGLTTAVALSAISYGHFSLEGCKPMRIIYASDDGGDSSSFECAWGCVPLSREEAARMDGGMGPGRCDEVGYRCLLQSGKLTLRNYYDVAVDIFIYVKPSADGSCPEK